MNQILITGDEVIKEYKQEKKVLPINTIVVFFAISIIILGLCIISGSLYSRTKINETIEANMKPVVDISRNDEDNTIEISIQHIRGITSISYAWNDEEATIINGKKQKNIKEVIDLIGGENTLQISITEENGQTVTYKKDYIVGNIPTIELEAVPNGVKIIATSDEKIDYIQYNWDDGEVQKVEVGEKQYEGIINAPTGEHLLKIEVVDINKMIGKKEQKVVGDTEPTLNVIASEVNGKQTFVVDAEDDENIKSISFIHNGGEKQVIEVNEKTYHYEITMTENEANTLIITVTNKNGLEKTKRVRFYN